LILPTGNLQAQQGSTGATSKPLWVHKFRVSLKQREKNRRMYNKLIATQSPSAFFLLKVLFHGLLPLQEVKICYRRISGECVDAKFPETSQDFHSSSTTVQRADLGRPEDDWISRRHCRRWGSIHPFRNTQGLQQIGSSPRRPDILVGEPNKTWEESLSSTPRG
jgi:hypothetical protein